MTSFSTILRPFAGSRLKDNFIRTFCIQANSKWIVPQGHKTNIKIYNPLTKCKVDLITQKKNILSWYSCGPTVYDSAHIGHASCYMQFDLIRRILEEFNGINVVMVMGVTDIDDKIINRANEIGVDFHDVSKSFEQEFFEDLSSLNIKPPTVKAKVSDHIDEIKNFVNKIVNEDLGYIMSDGTVNFKVEEFPLYGKLVSAQEETLETEKLSSLDFAMWKGAKPGEPSWSSPWGCGRPGWHIECSAIASKFFGKCVDLHSGGIDLKFPHHENEEAQCCAYHKINQWVNYWLHSGHLYSNSEVKMSKSLKNTVSVKNFLSKYSADHLRLLCMMVPYRSQYSSELMENVIATQSKFTNFLADCDAYIKGDIISPIDENALLKELELTRQHFFNCLRDDFDTSSALTHLFTLIAKTNSMLHDQTIPQVSESSSYSVIAVSNFIKGSLDKLGFHSTKNQEISISTECIIDSVVDFRSFVRTTALNINNSNPKETKQCLLQACDKFRDSLFKEGVKLKDHGKTTSWNIDNRAKAS